MYDLNLAKSCKLRQNPGGKIMISQGMVRVLGFYLFGLILLGIVSPLPLAFGQKVGEGIITSDPASGHPVSTEGITPSDVLARTELVRQELTAIQEEWEKQRFRHRV